MKNKKIILYKPKNGILLAIIKKLKYFHINLNILEINPFFFIKTK